MTSRLVTRVPDDGSASDMKRYLQATFIGCALTAYIIGGGACGSDDASTQGHQPSRRWAVSQAGLEQRDAGPSSDTASNATSDATAEACAALQKQPNCFSRRCWVYDWACVDDCYRDQLVDRCVGIGPPPPDCQQSCREKCGRAIPCIAPSDIL